MPSNHLVLCHTLLLLPSIFPSIRVFSNELALCSRWPEYWSFSFSISPSNEYSGLISFRIDWFDLLAVQGTLKHSLVQHHSSNASILPHSALFMVPSSHPYMTTEKTIVLIIGPLSVISLLFAFYPHNQKTNKSLKWEIIWTDLSPKRYKWPISSQKDAWHVSH